MEESDASIVTRVLAGETELYRSLIDRHKERCLRYARRTLCDDDAADDVLQETFIRAYKALWQCENRERFSAWLFQILVNRCRSALTAQSTHDRRFDRLQSNDVHHSADPSFWTFEESEHLDWAMRKLPEAQRQALLLKYIEELTYEEMAAITGTSIPALKMRVSRACEVLRIMMTRSGMTDV